VEAPCYCGRRACWEIAASRTGLQTLIEELHEDRRPDTIAMLLEVGRDASAGANAVLAAYGERVAAGLADLHTIHRAEIVVLGGSAAQLFDAALSTTAGPCAPEQKGWISHRAVISVQLASGLDPH